MKNNLSYLHSTSNNEANCLRYYETPCNISNLDGHHRNMQMTFQWFKMSFLNSFHNKFFKISYDIFYPSLFASSKYIHFHYFDIY